MLRKLSKPNDISPKTEQGIITPSDVSLEQFILGAIINSKDRLIEVIDLLAVETFFDPKHQIIYSHIISLFKEGVHPDLVNLSIYCNKYSPNEISPVYLSELCSNHSFIDVEYKARYLAELAIRRQLIAESNSIVKVSHELGLDIFQALSNHEKSIQDTIEQYTKKGIKSAKELTSEAILDLEKARHQLDGVSGIPTGFTELDRITSGWQKPDLIIIAARPAMGKTAFVLSMARNISVFFKKPIAFFSLEMSSQQLIKRLISVQTEVNTESFRSGKISDAEFLKIHQNIEPLIDAPIYFDDTAGLTILDLKTKATRLKKQYGIELIIIDYLQLMSSGVANGFREQEISQISRSLKMLAKELEIPIIALSQLSRAVETRGGDKRPILSDLRESGSIEQDADIVAFLHRPEYYGFMVDENGENTLGTAEFIIAKHRNGSTDTAKLKYIPQYTKFDNLNSMTIVNVNLNNQTNDSFEKPTMNGFQDEMPF